MSPEPSQIKKTRQEAKLTQTEAARLVYASLRSWQQWEAGNAKMHPGLWELFVMKLLLY